MRHGARLLMEEESSPKIEQRPKKIWGSARIIGFLQKDLKAISGY